MPSRIVGHVRSQLVGYVALFVALGGSAFAATELPANSVGPSQLRNSAVTGVKVAKHTLTGANINLSRLGAVPNALRLGGQLPAAFQSRVFGSCPASHAISAIAATGSVSCHPAGSGTITGVSGAAGSGLTGGGNSGGLTLGIDQSVIQHRLIRGCSSGQALVSVAQDGTPSCESFGSGSGTITSVSAGTGLTGGGSSGTVSLSVDPTAVQSRVSGSCSSGSAISSVAQGGTVGCQSNVASVGNENVVQASGEAMIGVGDSGNITVTCPNDRLAVKGSVEFAGTVGSINSTSYGRSSYTANVFISAGSGPISAFVTCFGGS